MKGIDYGIDNTQVAQSPKEGAIRFTEAGQGKVQRRQALELSLTDEWEFPRQNQRRGIPASAKA